MEARGSSNPATSRGLSWGKIGCMPVDAPVPEYAALLHELQVVRENGLTSLRHQSLPSLHQAAALAGLTTTAVEPQPPVIEQLIRKAVNRFGGGRHQRAAKLTFGLVGGTRFEPPTERRKQAAKACGVSTEQFRKTHEKDILSETTEAILALVYEATAQTIEVTGSGRPVPGTSGLAPDATPAASRMPMTTNERAVRQREPLVGGSQRRRTLSGATAAVLVVVGIGGGLDIALSPSKAADDPWNGMSAIDLQRRYDGKLPWGDDDESRCADQPGQPDSKSQPVDSNDPPVMGPEGTRVGTVYLRTSPICPTTAWARVVWNADDYEAPPGWQLHSVMYRPATNTRIEERDPPTPRHVPYSIPYYAISRMIASARGCVYAEVYFTNGEARTTPIRTSCVQA